MYQLDTDYLVAIEADAKRLAQRSKELQQELEDANARHGVMVAELTADLSRERTSRAQEKREAAQRAESLQRERDHARDQVRARDAALDSEREYTLRLAGAAEEAVRAFEEGTDVEEETAYRALKKALGREKR